jgi:hypothetical protein
MSVELYSIAKVARAKLMSEAAFKEHNLHRLVSHANFYDYSTRHCTRGTSPIIHAEKGDFQRSIG